MAAAATSPSHANGTGLELVPARSRSTINPLSIRPGRQTLGSDPACDLYVDMEGVAPQHCLIISGPQKTIIKALSPLTWINDGPVGESALRPGDRLIVGPVELLTRATSQQGLETTASPPNRQESDRTPAASRPSRPSTPVPPPLPPHSPLGDVAKLLRSADDSFPLPPPLPAAAPSSSAQSAPRAGRTLLRGESTFETRAAEVAPAAPPVSGGRSSSGEAGGRTALVAERERAFEIQSEELARVRAQVDAERAALADREARLGNLEQEKRILARQLEEMQLHADRELELAAELERERSASAALRAELDETRRASVAETPWDGYERRLARDEELEALRREVESLMKKVATSRAQAPEGDRNALLQQRTELLAIRREAQEKLAEQQRMTAELEQARQALQVEAEGFRRQQTAAEEEFARVEQRMSDLESRQAALSAREEAVQTELERISALQKSFETQSAELENRESALTTLQARLEEERNRLAAAQGEAEAVRRREEDLAAREAELDQVASQLEGEMQRIEQSAGQHRVAGQELESRRRELEERDRALQTGFEGLERQKQDLAESEQRIRDAEADLSTRLAEFEARQQALAAAEEALSRRMLESEEHARHLEERLAELTDRERGLDHREATLQTTLQAASQVELSPASALMSLESRSDSAGSLAELEQKSQEVNRLREEIEDRERRLSERERALEEHMRAIVLADAERAHWTREHDRLASQIAEMEERVEEWRQQEAALAECRVFITSRERAIEARLIDMERREAQLAEKEALVASMPVAAETAPSPEPAADPQLDRELEAARLNAESLAQRARELDGKFDALAQRESALDELAAVLRRREAELDEREEGLGASAPILTQPAPAAVDAEELSRLEADLRDQFATLDAEKVEIDQLRNELSQHREAFLEQFRNLEQERAEFYADQKTLGDEVARFEEERAAFLLERQAFEEDRLLSHVPLEQDGLPQWDGGAGERNLSHAPSSSDPADPEPLPAEGPETSIHDDRPALSWPTGGITGRGPFSMMEPKRDFDQEDEPSAIDEPPSAEALRTTAILEMDSEPQPEPPEVQSSDALELRAHLADLFGIDLSRRRGLEADGKLPEVDDAGIDEPGIDEAVEADAIRIAEEAEQGAQTLPEESEFHEDVDVATYMERLLARSRGSMTGSPAPPPPPVARPSLPAVAEPPLLESESARKSPTEEEAPEEEPVRPVRRPLQQQEKDAIRGSMDSFRELANRTARAAVARHQLVKLRDTLSTKGMLAGFCGLVTVILIVPEFWGSDRYRFPALASVCLTVIAGLEWLRTKVRIKKLDDFVAESDPGKDSSSDESAGAASEE